MEREEPQGTDEERKDRPTLLGDADDVDGSIEERVDEQLQRERDQKDEGEGEG